MRHSPVFLLARTLNLVRLGHCSLFALQSQMAQPRSVSNPAHGMGSRSGSDAGSVITDSIVPQTGFAFGSRWGANNGFMHSLAGVGGPAPPAGPSPTGAGPSPRPVSR